MKRYIRCSNCLCNPSGCKGDSAWDDFKQDMKKLANNAVKAVQGSKSSVAKKVVAKKAAVKKDVAKIILML